MNPYPIELRQRVLDAMDNKLGTQQEIANRFCVSAVWIRKLLHKRKTTGSIEPAQRTQGRKPAFNKEQLQELDVLVAGQCDITLAEIQEHFKDRVDCSLRAIANNLKRLGWGYKKKRYVRLSRIGKTLS